MPALGLFTSRRARAAARAAAARAEEDRQLLTPELMARVRAIQIRTHKLVNTALSGGYRSTFRGSGIEFSEVRAYSPGDDVRRIDWNVTARTGEVFVKTYAEERELPAAGMLEFRELEGGATRELDTRANSVRDVWAARAKARRETLLATFARTRADLLELDTTRDVGDSLRAFFRRRVMARGAKGS